MDKHFGMEEIGIHLVPTCYICSKCGQPMSSDKLCNSGFHVGPGEKANGKPISTVDLFMNKGGKL